MAYVINKFNGEQLVVLEDGTIDTTYGIGLVGRNYVGYGETQNENFVFLLENFSNQSPPPRPIQGQLWFDNQLKVLKAYDGSKWILVGAAAVSTDPPLLPNPGALWYRSVDSTLHIFNGSTFTLIGPESIPGYGQTKARAALVKDTSGAERPIIQLVVDNAVMAIIATSDFTLSLDTPVVGFSIISKGITVNNQVDFTGSLKGNASSATKLLERRKINGIVFDGTTDVTITASTPGTLVAGDYISGQNFNGSSNVTWSVSATSDAQIGTLVARDSAGNFQANTITANLIGNVVGNVQIDNGFSTFNEIRAQKFVGANLAGNADTANKLLEGKKINNVLFDGSQDITVTASATTLTGNFIASTVVSSQLEQVGTLLDLSVKSDGVTIGDGNEIKLALRDGNPYFRSQINQRSIDIEITDSSYINTSPRIRFLPSTLASLNGGESIPAFIKDGVGEINLGTATKKWNKVYSKTMLTADAYINYIQPESGNSLTVDANLIVTGDITVEGTVTSIESTETFINDKTITIAAGSPNAAAADGSGLVIDAANATFLYASFGDKWTMNKDLDMGNNDIITTGLFNGLATSARYADLAENYVADKFYQAGTVLEIGGTYEVTVAENESTKIAGVVSSQPAYLMNSQCNGDYVVAVALQGRVPCRVTGKICKGDMLVSAGNGLAKSASDTKPGSIIGKSLQDFEGIEGIIEVLVGRL